MSSPIVQAIKQICDEKQLSYEAVIETVEAALAAAYRKDFGEKNQNVKISFDPETGNMRAFDVKTVVEDELYDKYVKEEEERKKAAEEAAAAAAQGGIAPSSGHATAQGGGTKGEGIPSAAQLGPDGQPLPEEPTYNPKLNLSLTQAREFKKDAEVGEELKLELEIPSAFGRMAAMTAKQVITQRLREAERNMVYNELKAQEGQLMMGVVQRREGRLLLVDLGRIAGIMPPEEQSPTEAYNPGERIKVFIKAVNQGMRGPQVIVSRASEEMVKKLFSLEIPEVSAGTVVIHNVPRKAGSRSKVAVSSTQSNIDPIGSCIGQRGTRIQTIINELGGEKVDIIQYSDDAGKYIGLALAPAKVGSVSLDEAAKVATVIVPADQLSLAIGRGGQNVRLASNLTGWKINIKETGAPETDSAAEVAPDEGSQPADESK